MACFFLFYAIVTSIHDQMIVRLALIAIDFLTPEPGNYSYLGKLAFSASTVGDKGH